MTREFACRCLVPAARTVVAAGHHLTKAEVIMMRGRLSPTLLNHLGLILLTSTLSKFSGQAATLSWSGGSGISGNWNDNANWGFAGVPGNGDTLIFSSGQPRLTNTNNLSGLTVNAIIFAGAG